jgi:membrane associated rhomboid family serine protease
MVACCLILAFGAPGLLAWLQFDSMAVWRSYAFHQFLTYAFVHGPSGLIWFAIEMYMLFMFGREVERFFGRRSYIALYALLLLLPPVMLTFWGLSQRTGIAGSATLHFGIFVAFAVLFPNVQFFALISAKWVALILAAIGTLSALAVHDWQSLVVLWLTIAAAFLFIELRGAGPELAWLSSVKNFGRGKPRLHVVQKSSARRVVEPEDVYASVDPILDKIAKSGIGSLTASERRALDRARARLLNKDSD